MGTAYEVGVRAPLARSGSRSLPHRAPPVHRQKWKPPSTPAMFVVTSLTVGAMDELAR